MRATKTICLVSTLLAGAALADTDGHGPDTWKVDGVRWDDHLNVRAGPSTDYQVIGQLMYSARGIKLGECVPRLSMAQYQALRDAGRTPPSPWCVIHWQGLTGWVNARYLAEDGTTDILPGAESGPALVASEFLQLWQMVDIRGDRALLQRFVTPRFATYLTADWGEGPVFGGQDDAVSDFAIEGQSMNGDTASVTVSYQNFGEPQLMHLTLIRLFEGDGETWLIDEISRQDVTR